LDYFLGASAFLSSALAGTLFVASAFAGALAGLAGFAAGLEAVGAGAGAVVAATGALTSSFLAGSAAKADTANADAIKVAISFMISP
jgi:hypothetical protein